MWSMGRNGNNDCKIGEKEYGECPYLARGWEGYTYGMSGKIARLFYRLKHRKCKYGKKTRK